MRKILTVDGFAGCGKTAISRELAKRFRYAHLSSGLAYRLVGVLAIERGISFEDPVALVQMIGGLNLGLTMTPQGKCEASASGRIFTDELFTSDASNSASIVSAHQEVRKALLPLQRQAFPGLGLVAEGRDMGTVVFPDATVKFFINVDPSIRAERRVQQILSQQGEVHDDTGSSREDFRIERLREKVLGEMAERDRRDAEREVSPTKPASDAILVDNSSQSLTETVQYMYDLAVSRLT